MGLVIIESSFNLSMREFKICYDSLLAQKEKGIILLPPGFKATYVPDDVEIKMEDEDGRENLDRKVKEEKHED